MTGKRVPIGVRPLGGLSADDWVRQREAVNNAAGEVPSPYSARLTIDVTPELRGRIKVAAFRQGMTVAEMLRRLLEREFVDDKGIA